MACCYMVRQSRLVISCLQDSLYVCRLQNNIEWRIIDLKTSFALQVLMAVGNETDCSDFLNSYGYSIFNRT
jgi:hypothetical protein